jgi:putative copper export protein
MNAAIFFYFADVLSSIGVLLFTIGLCASIGGAFFTACYAAERGKYHGNNWIWVVAGVSFAICALIPSTKTMYMMAAAVLGEQALESKVGHQLKELVELKLDEELKKLKEKK